MIRQELTSDTVGRYVEAPPAVVYDILADVTRTPERTPDIVRCDWIDGATGPAEIAEVAERDPQERLGPRRSTR